MDQKISAQKRFQNKKTKHLVKFTDRNISKIVFHERI